MHFCVNLNSGLTRIVSGVIEIYLNVRGGWRYEGVADPTVRVNKHELTDWSGFQAYPLVDWKNISVGDMPECRQTYELHHMLLSCKSQEITVYTPEHAHTPYRLSYH